ncbi:acyl-CoA carboxylase epsilon subunit [Streptomyces sp. NPDC048603]|uniref:acyl-CoA carboxylase epsilon subunit n=1 Tax=Streptomyces sp. NPDC048603 TaxID=3365577 RepID=UPI00371DCD71
MAASEPAPPPPAPPVLIRVVRGRPDAEELAALTAVLLARAAAFESAPHDAPDGTSAGDPGAAVRRPAAAGWRRPERTGRPPGPSSWRSAPPPPGRPLPSHPYRHDRTRRIPMKQLAERLAQDEVTA